MRKFFKKPYRWAIIYSTVLIFFSTYMMLDTFVFTKAIAYVPVAAAAAAAPETETQSPVSSADIEDSGGSTEAQDTAFEAEASTESTEAPIISDTYYKDENIEITIETQYIYDTMVYIADIKLSDVSYLKTALAGNTYGRNIKDTTSDMAEENNAILAINGDYYGFRDYGFVLRNGVLYRTTVGDADALVIDSEGDFSIADESSTDAEALASDGAWQVLSFGPGLIENGEISVDADSEVGRSKTSNPRTAIGQIDSLHYLIIVSDGRTDESAGLTLLELAQIFDDYGCTTAYNLDGGGSSTMWFNGQVINNPTDGRNSGERSVSDIVYIG